MLPERFLLGLAIEEKGFSIDSDTRTNDFEALLNQRLVEDGAVTAAGSLSRRKEALLLELGESALADTEHLAQFLHGNEATFA